MPSTKPLSFIECETRNDGGAFVSLNLLLFFRTQKNPVSKGRGCRTRPPAFATLWTCTVCLFLLEELPVTWKVSEQTNNDKKTRGGLAKKAKAVFRGLGKQGVKVKCGRLERAVGSRGAAGGQGLRAELLGQLGAGDVSSCPAAPFLAFGALWHSGAADPVGLLGWYARDCSEAEEAALLGVIWCDLNETAMRAI